MPYTRLQSKNIHKNIFSLKSAEKIFSSDRENNILHKKKKFKSTLAKKKIDGKQKFILINVPRTAIGNLDNYHRL